MRRVAITLALGLVLSPLCAFAKPHSERPHAANASGDFKTICRGANVPAIVKELKKDVQDKLKAANIEYRSVKVSFQRFERTEGTYATSFLDNLTLSDGTSPTVTFAGSFPAPTACNVKAKLKIQVFYGKGVKTSTAVDVEVPGTMLFKSHGANDF